ncbi:zinc ABC transporter substrate-binding protein ZnuA [Vibrio rarus]
MKAASSSSLLDAAMSPHDYALRPSDIKKIRQADLVIWFGPDLESFMSSATRNQHNLLTISDIKGLDLHHFAQGHHDGDGHHHHGNIDPHFWLGPQQVASVATHIANKLSEIDPNNKKIYKENLDHFLSQLTVTTADITQRLKPVQESGYFVFHDGYGYFEKSFNLNHLGHFTVSPERKPGAKTLIEIKTRLAKGDVKCVFSEPQYTPAVVDTVTRGSHVSRGVLDPLATDIEEKPGAYFDFLNDLTTQFATCLK